ncbi:hypothetical protein QRX64_33725, partial [Pseudomonas aeruginosa]|uniref:hypothetical protein n=1 Tax=Pseudomonas aeruginosa TaxID=287 RepID=UPI002B23ED22
TRICDLPDVPSAFEQSAPAATVGMRCILRDWHQVCLSAVGAKVAKVGELAGHQLDCLEDPALVQMLP